MMASLGEIMDTYRSNSSKVVGFIKKGVSYSKIHDSPVKIWALEIPHTNCGVLLNKGVYVDNQMQTVLLDNSFDVSVSKEINVPGEKTPYNSLVMAFGFVIFCV